MSGEREMRAAGEGRASSARDDGPLARLVARGLAGAVPAARRANAARRPDATRRPHAARRPHARFAWALAPLVRAVEYGGLIWLAALNGPATVPAAFALIAALAMRQYDRYYGPRFAGAPAPPAWIAAAGLGWDGRLVLGAILLVAGAPAGAWYAWAALAGVLFAAEAIAGWAGAGAGASRPTYDDVQEAL